MEEEEPYSWLIDYNSVCSEALLGGGWGWGNNLQTGKNLL